DLDPEGHWTLASLTITGTDELSAREVKDVLLTKPRPWWAVWRPDPELDVLTLRQDVERIGALYRRSGFYEAKVDGQAAAAPDGHTVDVTIAITEGEPVTVSAVNVTIDGDQLARHAEVLEKLPVSEGKRFDEAAYAAAARAITLAYRQETYARVA